MKANATKGRQEQDPALMLSDSVELAKSTARILDSVVQNIAGDPGFIRRLTPARRRIILQSLARIDRSGEKVEGLLREVKQKLGIRE